MLNIFLINGLFSQYEFGIEIGTNYSKYNGDGYFTGWGLLPAHWESHPQLGGSTNLTFNHSFTQRFSYCLELGYHTYNNTSTIGDGSSYITWYEDGDYSMQYASFSIQPRIKLFKNYDIGFFTGISIQYLIHAKFNGALITRYYPLTVTLETFKYRDITTFREGGYLYSLLGFDYRYPINERFKITLDAMLFTTINKSPYKARSDLSETYLRNKGGSILVGLYYTLGNKEN